jgi:tRNA threonylcarbamoyladenosine modification (KEOPS) complex  Pcc1 subunit
MPRTLTPARWSCPRSLLDLCAEVVYRAALPDLSHPDERAETVLDLETGDPVFTIEEADLIEAAATVLGSDRLDALWADRLAAVRDAANPSANKEASQP